MDHWLLKNVTRKNLSEQEDLWKHRKIRSRTWTNRGQVPGHICPVSWSCLVYLSPYCVFLDYVFCPDSVPIFGKALSVVYPSGRRTRTRQSCSDFRCLCPPTSTQKRDPAVFENQKTCEKNWKIFLGCLKVRIKLGLILISVEYTAKYHVNYVVTMRYEKIITNK